MGAGLSVLGALLVGGGLFGIVRESTKHSGCKYDMGQVAQALSQDLTHQCRVDIAIFYAGYAALMVGILLMIAATGIGLQHRPKKRRSPSPVPRPQARPGWYPDPAGAYWMRWWDGYRWGPPAWAQPPARPSPHHPRR